MELATVRRLSKFIARSAGARAALPESLQCTRPACSQRRKYYRATSVCHDPGFGDDFRPLVVFANDVGAERDG